MLTPSSWRPVFLVKKIFGFLKLAAKALAIILGKVRKILLDFSWSWKQIQENSWSSWQQNQGYPRSWQKKQESFTSKKYKIYRHVLSKNPTKLKNGATLACAFIWKSTWTVQWGTEQKKYEIKWKPKTNIVELKQDGRLAPAYFSPNHKIFDQLLQTVKKRQYHFESSFQRYHKHQFHHWFPQFLALSTYQASGANY